MVLVLLHFKFLTNIATFLQLCILEQLVESLRSMCQVVSVVELELVILCISLVSASS